MRRVGCLLAVAMGCGGTTSGDDVVVAATADSDATSMSAAITDSDMSPTPGPSGGLEVWTTSLSELLRWDVETGTVTAFGQFATVALDASGAFWFDGGDVVVADPAGNTWPLVGTPLFILGGQVVYTDGGDTFRANLDGSGVEPYEAPPTLSSLNADNLDGAGLVGVPDGNSVGIWDLTSNPAVQVAAVTTRSEFISDVARAVDGTLFVSDWSWEEVIIANASGAALMTVPWDDLDFGSEELRLSNFAGPGLARDTVRVVAEQGFSNYAVGTLSAAGALTLDTIPQDNGLAGTGGIATWDGSSYVATRTEFVPGGITIVDVAGGGTTNVDDARVAGGIGVLVDWAGVR